MGAPPYGSDPTHPSCVGPSVTYDDEYDEMTVPELDDIIDEWEYDIAKSLKKAEKIAAIRAADAEGQE